jgi:hypothetical protein
VNGQGLGGKATMEGEGKGSDRDDACGVSNCEVSKARRCKLPQRHEVLSMDVWIHAMRRVGVACPQPTGLREAVRRTQTYRIPGIPCPATEHKFFGTLILADDEITPVPKDIKLFQFVIASKDSDNFIILLFHCN